MILALGLRSFAQSGSGGADPETAAPASESPGPDATSPAPAAPYAAGPAAATPFIGPAPRPRRQTSGLETEGVNWSALSRASLRFLAIEHGFRLLTEPGTREGLKGSWLPDYAQAVGNLHGWADGDEFYVNYVGHPMQGSVAGFLWVQNDRAYRNVEFGTDPMYWKSRLRAAAFAWAYSTQFEIGPLSEASIGNIQAYFPQQGFVDHVITPTIGMSWMIAEDVVDRYLVKRIEAASGNRWVRLLARSGLNPSRTFASVLQGQAPWHRDTRPGILSYAPANDRLFASAYAAPPRPRAAAVGDTAPVAPFELAVTFQPERFWGNNGSVLCLGGGAAAGFRLSASWQLVTEVSGCKFTGLEKNLSGDSLLYALGPRWTSRVHGPWSAYLQVLVGGNKVSEERMYPDLKKVLEQAAARDKKDPPLHSDYTDDTESNALTVATGGGVNYEVTRALTIRVADVSYRYAWTAPLWGRDYSNTLKLTSGVVLRMGTW